MTETERELTEEIECLRACVAAQADEIGKLRAMGRPFAEAFEYRLETILAHLYRDGCSVQVARLCDEELDRSGAMLGRIRDRARALSSVTKVA